MFLYINYPSWIHPEIFPAIPFLRWYGLMYIFAFGTAYLVLKHLTKTGFLNTVNHNGQITAKATYDDVFSFISFGILFLLLGARIFSTLVYDTSGVYRARPYLIFWPFNTSGKFTGFAGMSYHGGFIGGLLGMIIWCKRHHRPTLKWIDAMVICIPLGYTFGRLGNFLNGELYGRITTVPWGVIFPNAEKFSTSKDWVVSFCNSINLPCNNPLVNLPRHPSQLYEAFFEGIVLFAILFSLRNKHKWDGMMGALYTTGYGLFRFFIEYFREPDSDIGYRFSVQDNAVIYKNTSLLNISTGQILCLLMIIGGVAMFFITRWYSKAQRQKAQNTTK